MAIPTLPPRASRSKRPIRPERFAIYIAGRLYGRWFLRSSIESIVRAEAEFGFLEPIRVVVDPGEGSLVGSSDVTFDFVPRKFAAGIAPPVARTRFLNRVDAARLWNARVS